MRTLLNLLWLVFGGLPMALSWWLAGALAFISVVGIPWGRACFVIGTFAFWPFGREAVRRDLITGQNDLGTSAFGTLGNIIWCLLLGLWIALGHLMAALGSFVTIIGIPFGLQHLKLAGLALTPIGQTIVDKEVAQNARQRAAGS